jgi:hypothetical protein
MRPLHEVCKKDIKMLLGISRQALLGKAKTLTDTKHISRLMKKI